MSEEQRENVKFIQKTMKIMGLALGLPSTILGLFFFLKKLQSENIISSWMTLTILVVVVLVTLFLMVKYGSKSKT